MVLFIQFIDECQCVCVHWRQIKPRMNILSSKKWSEFNFILCFYLFVRLRFQCIWFMVEMLLPFFSNIDFISQFTWNSLHSTCACLNVFPVCNVHVTMTMWILVCCAALCEIFFAFHFISFLVIDAVANDTLQNTCEHGNNHAFNIQSTHARTPTCMEPANQILNMRCRQREFNLFASV